MQGMSEAKVEKIKEAAQKIAVCSLPLFLAYFWLKNGGQGSSFATGVEVQDRRKKVNAISTGSKMVDGILGGTPPTFRTIRLLTFDRRGRHVPVHN